MESNIIRLATVKEITGLSKSSIYEKMDEKSPRYDSQFPKRVKLGKRTVGWFEKEIRAWSAARPRSYVAAEEREEPCDANEVHSTKESVAKEAPDGLVLQGKRIEVVRQLLEKQASNGQSISYRRLMEHALLFPDRMEDRKEMCRIIDIVTTDYHKRTRALLGVLVQDAVDGGKYLPGNHFFELANSLGYDVEDAARFVNDEVIRLYEMFEKPGKKESGRLIWFQLKRERPMLVRQPWRT